MRHSPFLMLRRARFRRAILLLQNICDSGQRRAFRGSGTLVENSERDGARHAPHRRCWGQVLRCSRFVDAQRRGPHTRYIFIRHHGVLHCLGCLWRIPTPLSELYCCSTLSNLDTFLLSNFSYISFVMACGGLAVVRCLFCGAEPWAVCSAIIWRCFAVALPFRHRG
ncbi:hypothetical protein C8J57DRAFT_1356674 [Mycena rebaudengoi]|nr:hypothetical protein C8J57DRAFT_1415710 [Mycena rebaudengoi]KAJ7249331.1 hypothetical protein C8J57DRAFT_1356674 [Mycena rebaudengoi]